MRLGFCLISASLVTGLAVISLPRYLVAQSSAQDPGANATVFTVAEVPEAPVPQLALSPGEPALQEPPAQQTPAPAPTPPAQQPATQQPASPATTAPAAPPPAAPAPAGSSSQTPANETLDQKALREKAEEQLKAQEHQRVLGVMATFNTTRNQEALPLSSGQKYRLFFKSATDPWPFGLAFVVAGIGQVEDSDEEWGQGVQGYAKRFGGAYSDYFIGNFFGNAVLPSWWHEDPRYFQKGKGPFIKRFLWAAGSTVWCKRDRGGWGPNYANVVGNLIGSAIARTYYPAAERTVADTLSDGFEVSAEGILGAEVIEFWPDMVRHHRRKQAEKAAREAARSGASVPTPPQTTPPTAPPSTPPTNPN
jgi:hypothetical protein